MKLRFTLLITSFMAMSFYVSGQVSAFTNFQNQFMVWENGMIRKIEYLVPLKLSIGRNAIPYLDNSRSFKIYYKGAAHKINDGFTQNFQVTDNLITYQNASALWVWEDGKATNLSNYCSDFLVGDSLVLFFDGVQKEYRAYYAGNIFPIEGFLAANTATNVFNAGGDVDTRISNDMEIATGQLPGVKVSDNIGAYVNYANQFRIFYKGDILEQEDYLVSNFDVGRNTVAYVDANRMFKIFHKGNTTEVDNFPPYEYAVGDNLVAYVGFDNYFKIFYNDSTYTIGYFQPDFVVRDNVVAYRDATGYFKVFYKGREYTLESYYPSEFIAGYNSVAYVNRANVLRLFTEGEVYDVTNADVAKWQLDYDVLQYRFGANMYKVFYKGRTY